LFGELAALVAALIWAIGGTMLKPLSGRFHPLVLNQIRCLAAASLFAVFLAATGGFTLLGQVPLRSVIAGIAGTFIGIGIGESLFILSLRYMDISRAYPISSCAYPLITVVIAFFALNERLSGMALIGVFLVLAGIYFVAFPSGPLLVRLSVDSSKERRGLFLLLLTIIAWGVSVIGIKLGTEGLEMPLANFIRFSGTAVMLIPLTFVPWLRFRQNNSGWRNLGLAGFNGLLSFGIGAIFFLLALRETGAAMTSVLSSTSPLFLVPLAVLFLKEKVTPKLVLGVIMSVLGICLVFIF
jgi:drug/metabolite transporter (DMT)-like permease